MAIKQYDEVTFADINSALNGKINTSAITDYNGCIEGTDLGSKVASAEALGYDVTTRFFGRGTEHLGVLSETDLDTLVNTHTNNYQYVFSFKNTRVLTKFDNMGNTQFGFGWVNSNKDYGWILVLSFGGLLFGERIGKSSFTFTRVVGPL